MNGDPLEDYKMHCMEAQESADEAYATALLARSVSQFAKSVDEMRVMLKDRLDELINRLP